MIDQPNITPLINPNQAITFMVIGLTRCLYESNSGRVRLGVETWEGTNRESARIPQAFGLLPESDLLFLTLASQLCCLARPFIGTVRANPIGAPAPPVRGITITKSKITKKEFLKNDLIMRKRYISWEPLGRRQDLPERSRWGWTGGTSGLDAESGQP